MPTTPEPKKQWYVAHVLSGQEKSTARRLQELIDREELSKHIFEILVPEETVSEVKKGERKERQKKFFPGYILVNMYLYDEEGGLIAETWDAINNTDGIIGFAGTKNRPLPMRQKEVESMMNQIKERAEETRPSVVFNVGDSVKVTDGPFEAQTGIVEEIDMEKGGMRVSVTIFGRSTPVDLEFWQAEKE